MSVRFLWVQAGLTFVSPQLSSWAEYVTTQVATEGDSFQFVHLNVVSYVLSFLSTEVTNESHVFSIRSPSFTLFLHIDCQTSAS